MKMKPQRFRVLNAIFIAGFLLACLFYSSAQCDDRQGDVFGTEVEETLYENLEEECLAEKSHDFQGQAIVSEQDASSVGRVFDLCVCRAAGSSAICLRDWMIPLRI